MILKVVVGLLFLLGSGAGFAQSGVAAEKGAMRNIDRHRWRKANEHLQKSLKQDSVNAATRYAFAVFYFHPENPAFDLDSAHHFAVGALHDYARNPSMARDRLMRLATDSAGLVSLKERIDSTAFATARHDNTEAAYQKFLSHFPSARQRDLAVSLRDEIAFQHAVAENSVQAFLQFVRRYPLAARAGEAQARYARLLYDTETADGQLATYEKFLHEHPETPYRKEADGHIFEIATADGIPARFIEFITRYPTNTFVSKARRMLFYMLSEQEAPEWPRGLLNDSLRFLLAVNKTYLAPILQNGRYGFIDKDGQEVFSPQFEKISDDYLCGYITDGVLHVDNKLITRTGSQVYSGAFTAVTDLGIGFLKIATPGGVTVVHKGGFVVIDSVGDARIVGNRYIAVRRNGAWQLATLTGRLFDHETWDTISSIGHAIVFSSDDKKFLMLQRTLRDCAAGAPLPLSEPFDEVKLWSNGHIWGRSGEFQGVLNDSLHRVIGFDRHVLTRTFFGAMAQVPHGLTLYNEAGKRSSTFEAVNIIGRHVAVRKNRAWYAFDVGAHEVRGNGYDSLTARGAFMVGHRADSVYIYFEHGRPMPFFRPHAVSFIPGMDSASFLLVEERRDAKSVFDLAGKKLFTATFDAIEYAGQGVFVITRKGKKGVLGMAGERLLPVEFDAVGSAKDQRLSLLKDQRFGAYRIATKKYIRPQYERNLLPYNENILTTFRDGHYGFLEWNNKALSAFEFDEIRYWDDSVALVKTGGQWRLYSIFTGEFDAANLRKVTIVNDSDAEKVAIVQEGNRYGILSSRRHEVIPATFTQIINVGSAEEPLYFTETHVKEASLFVIIYYDRLGNFLRKEIYDDAMDYDKIYCSDN